MAESAPRRTNVTIRLTPCRNADKGRLLRARLEAARPDGAELFRVKDATAARGLGTLLRRLERDARFLLPEQDEPERLRTAAWFATADRPTLIVAGAFSLPENRSDVRSLHVMNLPVSLVAAAADLAAVGRDGLDASAEFFASESDRRRLAAGIEAAYAGDACRGRLERLNQAVAWLEHDGCARVFLARGLRGETAGVCGNCGWCLGRKGTFLPPE